MPLYLRDGSAQTILRAATLRQKLQIQLSTSPSQYTDTRPTSHGADPLMQGAWQGSHRQAPCIMSPLSWPTWGGVGSVLGRDESKTGGKWAQYLAWVSPKLMWIKYTNGMGWVQDRGEMNSIPVLSEPKTDVD